MNTISDYQEKREALRKKYLHSNEEHPNSHSTGTGGVDHLALISSDIESTIEFYTNVVEMKLSKVLQNRDEPTSTHIFLDMGGGNLLAFFDFPKHGDKPVIRGIGAMHHLALKATSKQYKKIITNLRATNHNYDLQGDEENGSVYFRDPDNILLEVRCDNKNID